MCASKFSFLDAPFTARHLASPVFATPSKRNSPEKSILGFSYHKAQPQVSRFAGAPLSRDFFLARTMALDQDPLFREVEDDNDEIVEDDENNMIVDENDVK